MFLTELISAFKDGIQNGPTFVKENHREPVEKASPEKPSNPKSRSNLKVNLAKQTF